jgi:type I restriction enzyme, S subunit
MKYSVVHLGRLSNTKSFRLDAEYYHPKALEYEDKIVNVFHGESIKNLNCSVVSGPFGSSLKSEAYLNDGVPFVRISNLRDFLISKKNLIYISEKDNARLSSSQLNVGDIVLSKVGNTIGVASLVTNEIGPCNISENNIGIRLANGLDMQTKSFIVTYLNSTPGQNQILRAISGNAQPKLNVSDIEQIKVPHVSAKFVNEIHQVFAKSMQLISHADMQYAQTQTQVLAALGLLDWHPKQRLSFVKNHSETIKTDRIDAEYYQPKYDEIVKAIKGYSGGWDTLGNIASITKCLEVGSEAYKDEGDIPFVRISNLSPFEIKEEKYISDELYAELSQHQPQQK